jgi:ribosomal protein S24E
LESLKLLNGKADSLLARKRLAVLLVHLKDTYSNKKLIGKICESIDMLKQYFYTSRMSIKAIPLKDLTVHLLLADSSK